MVDDAVGCVVELRREHRLGYRHTHGRRQALSERARRRLYAGKGAVFGMSCAGTTDLPEALDIVDCEAKA